MFEPRYPNGSAKAFTLSYDDGARDDAKVMELCRRYGLKCTFALNTGFWGKTKDFNHLGFDIHEEIWEADEVREAYRGFEVAGHSHNHPARLNELCEAALETEIVESNLQLAELLGYPVQGFTYPCNSFGKSVDDVLRKSGILYSRTTDPSEDFELPEDFLRWNPSAHDHDENVPELIESFHHSEFHDLRCLYLWGHSLEFQKSDPHIPGPTHTRWDDIERIFRQAAECSDFWFATNIELCSYVLAVRRLEAGKGYIRNPSAQTIYGILNGKRIALQPGNYVLIPQTEE